MIHTVELKKAILKDLELMDVNEITAEFKDYVGLVLVDYVLGSRVSKHNRIVKK